jgi:predicted DNA-binding protein
MSRPKKIKKSKKRFKSFTFKLSYRQYESLKNFSALKGTTPLKIVKERIHDCIEEYSNDQLGKESIAKNQLSLFKQITPEEQQLKMFEK